MNPPSERRFPRLPLAKAEAGASPGAAAVLEDLIDACVMESYFREHMAERDLLFHDTVAPHLAAYAPEASAAQRRFLSPDKLNEEMEGYQQGYALYGLTPEEIAIVEGTAK